MKEIEKSKKPLTKAKVVISLLAFTALWALVTDAWGTSQLIFGESRTIWLKYAYDMVSRIIWVAPVFILFHRYQANLRQIPNALVAQRPNIKLLLLFLLIFTLYAVGGMFLVHGEFRVNPSFHFVRQTTFYLMVAFVEEAVYRGWGLNAFASFMTERKANLLSTVFFIILHWPAYFIRFYITGTFQLGAFLEQSLVVLIMGLIFGYVFRKSKSIWTPIILHAYFDWIVDLLVS